MDAILAAGSNGFVYKGIIQSDESIIWDSGTNVGSGNYVYGLCQLINGTILATVNGGTIFKSLDNGATWSLLSSVGSFIFGITQLTTGINAGYVLTGGNGGSIYQSVDNGSTWTHVSSIGGGNCRDITQLTNGDILAVSSNGYVYKSTNNASTWDSGTYVTSTLLNSIALINSDVYTTSYNGYVFKSSNNGSTWDSGSLLVQTNELNGMLQLSNGLIIFGANDGNIYAYNTNYTTIEVLLNGSTPVTVQSTSQNIPSTLGTYTTNQSTYINSNNSGEIEVIVGNSPISGSAIVTVDYIIPVFYNSTVLLNGYFNNNIMSNNFNVNDLSNNNVINFLNNSILSITPSINMFSDNLGDLPFTLNLNMNLKSIYDCTIFKIDNYLNVYISNKTLYFKLTSSSGYYSTQYKLDNSVCNSFKNFTVTYNGNKNAPNAEIYLDNRLVTGLKFNNNYTGLNNIYALSIIKNYDTIINGDPTQLPNLDYNNITIISSELSTKSVKRLTRVLNTKQNTNLRALSGANLWNENLWGGGTWSGSVGFNYQSVSQVPLISHLTNVATLAYL